MEKIIEALKEIQSVIDSYEPFNNDEAKLFKERNGYKLYLMAALKSPYQEFEGNSLPAFEHFKRQMTEIYNEVNSNLANVILIIDSKEQHTTIERIKSYLLFYLDDFNLKKKANPFFEIFEVQLSPLLLIIERLQKDYLSKFPVGENEKSYQIQWNGGVATLGTLFYELRKTTYKNGEPYISSTPPDVVSFVLNNFVDSNNKPFNFNSLNTYITNDDKEKAQRRKFSINNLEIRAQELSKELAEDKE